MGSLLTSDFLPQTTALLSALGALFTGLAAMISAFVSSRLTRRRMREDCDRRVAELTRTFRAGMKLADQRPLRAVRGIADDFGERWSHLE